MLPPITTLQKLRKQLHLTQQELSQASGVSQSLIAKVESNKVNPSYTKAKKLFDTLDHLRNKEQMTAKDIMQKKIIFAQTTDHLSTIIEKMRKAGISQVPVRKDHLVCGTLTERHLLRSLHEKKGQQAHQIMGPAPPVVDVATSLASIQILLHDAALVLVTKAGNLQGIITRTDVLAQSFRA